MVLKRLSARPADMLTPATWTLSRASVVCGVIAFMEISLHVFRNRTNVNMCHLAFTQKSNPSLRLPGSRQTGFRKMIFFFSSRNSVWAGRKLIAALIILNHLHISVCTGTDTVLYNVQVSSYLQFKINLCDVWVEKWCSAKRLCASVFVCPAEPRRLLAELHFFFTCSNEDEWYLLSSSQTLSSLFIIPCCSHEVRLTLSLFYHLA